MEELEMYDQLADAMAGYAEDKKLGFDKPNDRTDPSEIHIWKETVERIEPKE